MSDLCVHCGMAIYQPIGSWWHSSGLAMCNGGSWAEPALVTRTSSTRGERDEARRIAVALEQENAFLLDECAALQRALTECQYLLNGWYTAAHQLGDGGAA